MRRTNMWDRCQLSPQLLLQSTTWRTKAQLWGQELNYHKSVQEGGFDKEILVGFKRIGFDLLCDCSHYHGHKQTQ